MLLRPRSDLLVFTLALVGCSVGDSSTPTSPFGGSAPSTPGLDGSTGEPTATTTAPTTTASTGELDPGVTGPGLTTEPAATTDAPAETDGACGDGVVDAGEACDDGNLVDTDLCTASCQNAACGDGHLQPGEGCDDGNAVSGDGCEPDCTLATCGDGKVQAGEQCDDGNAINTDACVQCQPAVCGDGLVFQGGEQCDDANAVATDACVHCKTATCGDGVVWSGVEKCDGGAVLHGQCTQCAVTCQAGFGDCDGLPGTGCESTLADDPAHCGSCAKSCAAGQQCIAGDCVGEYGPKHSFAGFTSDLYVTQGCCSVNCAGDNAIDAAYFCSHFYAAACKPKPGYLLVGAPDINAPKMHKNGGCSALGVDIPQTQCDGGPCKMLTVPVQAVGLTNLVCQCP